MSANVIAFTKVALPYGWLGNMSPDVLDVGGLWWLTAEALFQARRFAPDDPVREEIRLSRSPMGAKMIAKKNRERMVIKPQSQEDLDLMFEVMTIKLTQHPRLRRWLAATGDATIIEDCTARPRGSGLFWGAARQVDGSWKGENHLGKLWMRFREANMTKERAHQIWEQRGPQNSLDRTDMTSREKDFVYLVWEGMPDDTSWMDAFFEILNGRVDAEGNRVRVGTYWRADPPYTGDAPLTLCKVTEVSGDQVTAVRADQDQPTRTCNFRLSDFIARFRCEC